ELVLTTANLTASRLTVFALAGPGLLASLADRGMWTVDLTGKVSQFEDPKRGRWSENLLHVSQMPPESRELLVEAALTSCNIPMAFPTKRWKFSRERGGGPEVITQDLVDGGVLDSSPIDIAVLAGATHI